MAQPVIHTSFGAGEISRNLFARVDLDKYHVGAALLRNFFVDYRGGAPTRAGFEYIATCRSASKPRLIPFQFSSTETYVLEFGQIYVRIYQSGTLVQEIVTPYSEADLPLLKYAQSADTMTLTHPSYPIYLLKRTAVATFSLATMVIGPTQAPPTSFAGFPVTGGGGTLSSYIVTAFSQDGKEESIPSNVIYIATDHNDVEHPIMLTWDAPTGLTPSKYHLYKWGPNVPDHAGGFNALSVFGYIGEAQVTQFVDSGYEPDFTKQPQQFQDPFTPGQATGVVIDTAGTSYTPTTPPTVLFSDSTEGHAILDYNNGVRGVIIDFYGGNNSVPPSVSFTGGGGSGTTAHVPSITPTSGTYPSCVSFFQQRQCFAASTNAPQTVWTSQTGSVYNFNRSPLIIDSDAITISLASRQINQIKSMVPTALGMLMFTSSGPWLLSGGGQQLAVTPTDIAAQPQASSGANDMPPLVVNNHVLYVQNRGSIVRDLVSNIYVQSYLGTDRSALANQLFTGFTLSEWAFAEEPYRNVWCVRDDGILLCMAYVPEQEVYAWSHHDTQGAFLSVCSIVEGQEDALYVIVQRYINGAWVNYIERQHTRNFYSNVELAFCVDAGLSLAQSTPAAILSFSNILSTVTVTASASVFALGDVGKVIRGLRGGKLVITSYSSGTSVNANVVPDGLGNSTLPTLPNTAVAARMKSGNWMMAAPVTHITGLTHLIGQTVYGLADGQVVGPLTVASDGSVDLAVAASYVSLGLSYQCQLQTLYLDTGDPTIQSKRKLLPALTARVNDARGLKVGQTFARLTEYKEPAYAYNYSVPAPVFTGDLFTNMYWEWNKFGEVCVQQDYPLPATVLGLIPQVVLGDTGK